VRIQLVLITKFSLSTLTIKRKFWPTLNCEAIYGVPKTQGGPKILLLHGSYSKFWGKLFFILTILKAKSGDYFFKF